MNSLSQKRRHYSDEKLTDRSETVQRAREELKHAAAGKEFEAALFELAKLRNGHLPDTEFEVVSGASGKILELCIALPSSIATADSAVLNIYLALLSSLPPEKKVFVICDDGQITNLKALFIQAKLRCEYQFVAFEAGEPSLPFGKFEQVFTNWIQDPFISLQSQIYRDQLKFIEPYGFFDMSRRVDMRMAASLAKARASTSSHKSDSVFMGGNILSLTDHVLIGGDELYHHEVLCPESIRLTDTDREHLVAARLAKHLQTSKKVIFVRTSAVLPPAGVKATTIDGREWREETVGALNTQSVQPIFHIDMFITPTGVRRGNRDVVLVGDPRLAAKQLKRITTDAMMIPAFDEIADLLAQHFYVIRNPLPLVFMDIDDCPKASERKWYFASYNNALVEADRTGRCVWLPNYGFGNWSELKTTDESTRRIWRELGFDVYDVGDCHPLAERRGVVHCITNVLRRAR